MALFKSKLEKFLDNNYLVYDIKNPRLSEKGRDKTWIPIIKKNDKEYELNYHDMEVYIQYKYVTKETNIETIIYVDFYMPSITVKHKDSFNDNPEQLVEAFSNQIGNDTNIDIVGINFEQNMFTKDELNIAVNEAITEFYKSTKFVAISK